jgi:hypothetical protein
MNLKQVNTAIMQGNWTNDDLNSMIDAVKWRRAQLAKTVKNQLSPGTAVRFNSQKLGGMVSGTLESVKIKFATVNTSRGRWRVPINMLETA